MNNLAITLTCVLIVTVSPISGIKVTPNYDFPEEQVKIFEIGCVLTLVCAVTGESSDQIPTFVRWYKNVDESRDRLIEANHHYELKHETLRIENPVSNDAGQYHCSSSHGQNASITVIANAKAVLSQEYYFVEGETLNITCVVDGTQPYVTWRIGNVSYNASTDHVVVERGERYGRLLISDVHTNDTNVYTCVVENRATKLLGIGKDVSTQIHVWQRYVILWPFIGVCFEVAILCAAIAFYEVRCTKPEMELDDIEELEDEEMEGDINEYDFSSGPVSAIDVRLRK